MEEPGGVLGQQIRPIQNVGVYAPGGTAVLFSTLLMNVIPAQVAGCPRIAVASPPQSRQGGALNPTTLTACHLLRQHEVYRIGGAQAIAALALGTETIPRVDMICGPGNIYVTEAKRQLQGKVRIDSLAGPTEVVIIADEKARADFIAADLLAQLEHDASAAAMLLTPAEIRAILLHLCDDPAVIRYRQDVIDDLLTHPDLAQQLKEWGVQGEVRFSEDIKTPLEVDISDETGARTYFWQREKHVLDTLDTADLSLLDGAQMLYVDWYDGDHIVRAMDDQHRSGYIFQSFAVIVTLPHADVLRPDHPAAGTALRGQA